MENNFDDVVLNILNMQDAEAFSDLFEQDSRRYSNKFTEEQEVSGI